MTRVDLTDQKSYDQKPCMWREILWNIAEIHSAFIGTGMNQLKTSHVNCMNGTDCISTLSNKHLGP